MAHRRWRPQPAGTASSSPTTIDVRARRDAQLDLMADLITAHLDVDAVIALLEHGPPKRPTVASALRG